MNRRGIFTGLVSLIAGPAIVRASSLMTISPARLDPLLLDQQAAFAFMQQMTPGGREIFMRIARVFAEDRVCHV